MMRKRKFLPSALALALCTVLASCGGDGGGGDSGGAAPTATNTPINNSQEAKYHNNNTNNNYDNADSSTVGSTKPDASYNGPDFSGISASTAGPTTAQDDPVSSISSIDSVHVASGSSVSSTFTFSNYNPKNAAKIVRSLKVTSLESNDYSYIPNSNYNINTIQKTFSDHNYLQDSLFQAFVGFTGSTRGTFNAANSWSPNSLIYFSEGFTPIYNGRNLTLSSLNVDGKVSFLSPSTNYNYSLFNSDDSLKGSNLRVAMIDGGFNLSELGNFNPFQLNPIEINLKNLGPEYQGNYAKLSQGENHGLLVGTVISARRNYGGLVPKAQLYYAQANSEAQRIGKILLNTYNQSHPVVINNSYQFNYVDNPVFSEIAKIKFNNNPYSDIQRRDNLNNLKELERIAADPNGTVDVATSIYAGLKALTTRPDSPLIVFAAGNYNFLDSNNTGAINPELRQIVFNAYKSDKQKVINNFVNNPDAGISITNEYALAQYLADPDVAKNLIIATGVYFDPSHQIENAQWNFKYNNFIAPYKDMQQAAQAAGIKPPEINSSNNYKFNQRDYKSNYISAFGAYQCGVTAFSCVAVSYQYYYPNQYARVGDVANNFDGSLGYYSTGTSFGAPVVSAAAIMLKQQFPWMTASNLKTTILTTATDVGAPGVDEVFGWGILNIANALRGPQVFAFGDFDANLANRALTDTQLKAGVYNFQGIDNPDQEASITKTSLDDSFNFGHNSYFVNNIVGTGGLNVFGKDSDFLYLTGNNKYVGSTTINSGNLVLINPQLLHLGKLTRNKETALASQVNVNRQGHFFSYYANLNSNLYNNGQTTLVATNISGNYIAKPGSITVLGVPGTTKYRDREYNTESVFRPVQVQGTAQLAGTLALTNNIVQSGIEQFVPVLGKTQVLLVADKIDGQFDNKYIPTNDVFKNYIIRYSDDRKALSVTITTKNPDAVTASASAGESVLDKRLFGESTVTVNNLFSEANNETAIPSSGGAIPGISGGLDINTNPNILPGFNTGSPQTVTQGGGTTSINGSSSGNTSTSDGNDSASFTGGGIADNPGSIGGSGGLLPKLPGHENVGTGGSSRNSILGHPALNSLSTPVAIAPSSGQSILNTGYYNNTVSHIPSVDQHGTASPASGKTAPGVADAASHANSATKGTTANSNTNTNTKGGTNSGSTTPVLAGQTTHNTDGLNSNSGVVASAGSDSTNFASGGNTGSIGGVQSLGTGGHGGITLSNGKQLDKHDTAGKADESSAKPSVVKPLTDTQAAVAKIQNYNLQQYKALLYQVGATSYADAQMTSALNTRFLQNSFTDRVGSRFLSPDDSFKVFAQYQHSNTNYKNKDTAVKGKNSSNGGIFGGYAQKGGWNYGFAVTQLNSSWNEKVTIPEYTDKVGQMHPALERALAETTVHTFGTEITVGKAYEDKAFAFSGYFTYHHYDMKRASLSMKEYDQSAKFSSYDLGFSGIYTQQLLGDQAMGLIGKVGFNLEDHHTGAFDETAIGSDVYAAKALSLHTESTDKLGAYANLGLEGFYNFDLGNFHQKFSAQFTISQSLMPQDYTVKVKVANGDKVETSNAFKNRFNARVDLNYSIDLAQNVNLGVSGHYDYTPNWHDVKADINLTYSF